MDTESMLRIWARRAVTIPMLHLMTAILIALLPVLLIIAGLLDVVLRRPALFVRALLVVALNLVMHCLGVWMLIATWLFDGDWDRRFEVWWTRGAYRTMEILYRMRTVVEGDDAIASGPFLLFARHSSILDPLLPLVLIGGPHRRCVRFVAKRDLLMDPCVDIIGHRLPMAFVRRGTRRHERDVAEVVHLLDDLEPRDVVLIYPEGTRFTDRKRARFLAELEVKDPERHARASRLENLLPPHTGGILGLLEHNPGLDVVFCASTGLERARHLSDFFAGALLGGTVHVRFWRVPFAEIPKTRAEQLDWFYGWWTRLDRWIGDHHQGEWMLDGKPALLSL